MGNGWTRPNPRLLKAELMADSDTVTQTRETTALDVPWNVVVHDDPVNLMQYVTYVLMKVFGYDEKKATTLMMQVHQQGRSIVWTGEREKAEFYTQQVQSHQLKTSLEKADMKAMPTLEGGLRIDAESADDWVYLNAITLDAASCDKPLAERLGNLISDPEVASDWRDFVIPDLDEGFSTAVRNVGVAIASAQVDAGGKPGALWITRDDAADWYGTLNQARLALEEIYHFGPGEKIRPASLPPVSRDAFMRSQFYCAIQSLLLEHVLR